jgi:hypothetical protein
MAPRSRQGGAATWALTRAARARKETIESGRLRFAAAHLGFWVAVSAIISLRALSHPTRGKFYRRQRGNPDDCGLRISCPCSASGFSQTQRTNLAATGGNANTSCPPSPLRELQRCVQVLLSREDRNPYDTGAYLPQYTSSLVRIAALQKSIFSHVFFDGVEAELVA